MTDQEDNEISKSQRKRDMTLLQKLGESLVKLTETQLHQIPLPAGLSQAILTAQGLKNHEALRRQLQYIGKLMRHVDAQPIQEALEKIQLKGKQAKAAFHKIEQWRDRLIEEGDSALLLFLNDHPEADIQRLRQLMRKSQKEKGKNTGGRTALFAYLREILTP